ncbi:DUF2786 domain-containing protein [Salmonella enterica]|nr:DUF2786 domain-containing protein [Salmonella enterica]EGG4133873.1 DUF2786 domain-containing protein [Salmonella enterica]
MIKNDNTIAKIKKLLAIAERSNNKEEAKNAFSKAYNYMKALNVKFEDIYFHNPEKDSHFYKNKEISLSLEKEIIRRKRAEGAVCELKRKLRDINESYEKEQFWREQAEKKQQEALLAMQSSIIFRIANYIYKSENRKSKLFLLTIGITVLYLICTMFHDSPNEPSLETLNTHQIYKTTTPTLIKKTNSLSKKDSLDTVASPNAIANNTLPNIDDEIDNEKEPIISSHVKKDNTSITNTNTQSDGKIPKPHSSSVITDTVKKHSVLPLKKVAVLEFSDASTIPRICIQLNKVTHKPDGNYLYTYFTFELSSPTLLIDDSVTKYYKIIKKISNGWYEFEGGGSFNFSKDGKLIGMTEGGHKYSCFASEKVVANYLRMMKY